jgi:hypothetical protein
MKRLLFWLYLLAVPAWAQPVDTDWPALRVQATEMRATAHRMRSDAAQAFTVAERDCWQKVLVSGCQKDAREVQRNIEKEARRIDLEALAMERRIAAHEREERRAQKAARLQERDQHAAGRAEQIRLDDAAHRLRVEKKQAEIERKQRRRAD